MKYKAIFFDWDGTAVTSRKAPVDEVVKCMKPLLASGIKLIIISGTTYERIAEGKFHEWFTKEELDNLYLGLGRGAHNYSYKDGELVLHDDFIPTKEERMAVHKCVFDIHQYLLEKYDLESDIVFNRPNYCKLDMMVAHDRGDHLFLQESEIETVNEIMKSHGIEGGLTGIMSIAEAIGKEQGLELQATTDAKYLEIGYTTKSDNTNFFVDKVLAPAGIEVKDACFWGDEFTYLAKGIKGSDAYMMTEKTTEGNFFDVSSMGDNLPEGVVSIGGGTASFLNFLKEQAEL